MRTCTVCLLLAGIGLAGTPDTRSAEADAQTTGEVTQATDPADTTQGEAQASDDCRAPSQDCVAVGHWNLNVSLGAGIRTDPVVHEADIPLVVIPQVSYYGKRFFLEDLDAGVALLESKASTLSLIASPGYDRVFFYRSDPQNFFISGLPLSDYTAPSETPATASFPSRPRHWTYLAGPEWTFKAYGITGQLDVLHEITGQNHGNEVRAALGIPLVESTGSLAANVGLTWKSAAIVNYYYGAQGVYEGGAALDPFIKVSYSRPLSSKWRLTAFVEYEHLGNAIADSPIVNASYVVTAFAGANYSF
jgi:MipA family protein